VTAIASCGSSDDAPSEKAAIVAAMAAHRVNNSDVGDAAVDRINVIDQFATPRPQGFLVVGDDGRAMDASVREAVERSLAPAAVTWIHTYDEVIGDRLAAGESPTYEDVGVILTFGEPAIDGSQATIVSELWCGMLCGGGTTYTLTRADGADWVVTGTTGNGWNA
jgi:hypothetical protein